MKIAQSSNTGNTQKKTEVLLPLTEDPKLYKLDKTNSVSWELSTIPGTAGAATYKCQVRILQGDETPRQMIRWRLDVLKVCQGLNATTFETRRPIMEACMRVGPLAFFHSSIHHSKQSRYDDALKNAVINDARATNTARAALATAAAVTTEADNVRNNGVDYYAHNADLDAALGWVITNMLPRKILARVKRAMRRETRKPTDMTVRSYYQNLLRMNSEELPNLPPFRNDQSLSMDELMDIILFGTPRSWQNEMERQGFDPMEHAVHEVVDFMENIEGTEEKPKPKDSSKSKSDKSKGNDSKPKSKKKAPYYCKEHGPNYTHDTADCLVLKKQKSGDGKYSNKTWSRKAEESSSKTKKDLAALVAKVVKKGVKKELAAMDKGKKRKSDSDSEEEGDCFLVEELTKDLDGFNYEDMEKLSLEDEEDGEITDEVDV